MPPILKKPKPLPPEGQRPAPGAEMETVDTPKQHSIEEVSQFLNIDTSRCLKTLLVEGEEEGSVVALVVRGDHELNEVKAEKLPQVKAPLSFASEQQVKQAASCAPGSVGPVGLKITVIADHSAAHCADFVCGANQDNKTPHWRQLGS